MPLLADGVHDGLFGARLGRPAPLVGGEAQVPVGYDNYGVPHVHILTPRTPDVYWITPPFNDKDQGWWAGESTGGEPGKWLRVKEGRQHGQGCLCHSGPASVTTEMREKPSDT
jgi:hypothetical protein